MEAQPEQPEVVIGSDNKVPTKEEKKQPENAKPKTIPTNDNSNPQQGSGGARLPQANMTQQQQQQQNNNNSQSSQRSFKIPPTKKDSRKLFVGGLPSDVTDQEFRTFFEQFGAVLDSVVMFDRETHRSRGFGFVTFVDQDVSLRLLQMGNPTDGVGRLVMRGKTCEVKAAEPKESSFRGAKPNLRADRREQRQHHHPNNNNHQNQNHHPNHHNHHHHHQDHMFPHHQMFSHPHDAMMYHQPPPDVIPPSPMPPYPYYPPGVAGYMAPMYYPHGGNGVNSQAVPPHQQMPEYSMHHHHHPHAPAVVGQYVDPMELGAPPMQPHLPAYPIMPYNMPVPPTPTSVPYAQSSVMQPVAPGIPTREGAHGDGPDANN